MTRIRFTVITIMTDMVNSMVTEVNSNNLKAFKSYLENHKSDVDGYISDIQYSYDVPLYIYSLIHQMVLHSLIQVLLWKICMECLYQVTA